MMAIKKVYSILMKVESEQKDNKAHIPPISSC